MSKHYVSLCFKTNIHSTMSSMKTTSLCISIVGAFLRSRARINIGLWRKDFNGAVEILLMIFAS